MLRLHLTGRALHPNWTSTTHRACRVSSATANCTFRFSDAIALAIENNLDIAYFRYNFPIAQTDIMRTKSGGTANGVNTSIIQYTQGGFGSSSSGGGGGGGGNSGGSGYSAGNGGIVTSTLGAGVEVPSFDPILTFKGYVDHTVPGTGQPVSVRRADPQNQHHSGPRQLQSVLPARAPTSSPSTWDSALPATPRTTPSILSCIPISLCRSRSPCWRALAAPPTSDTSASPSATPRSPTLRFKSQVDRHRHAGREHLLGPRERLSGRADHGSYALLRPADPRD